MIHFDVFEVSPPDTGGLGLFVSFLVVFYVSQCFSRFYNQYFACTSCRGRIFDACCLIRTGLKDKEVQLRLWRYISLIHISGYCGLTPVFDRDNLFFPMCDKYGLLTPEEKDVINEQFDVDNGGACNRGMVIWALDEITKARENQWLSPFDAMMIRDHILQLRAGFGKLYDYSEQGIPFAYSHLISLTSAMYMWTYAFSKGALYKPDGEAFIDL